MWLFFYLQVSQEPGNTEAREKSALIDPLQQQIEQARGLYEHGDYQSVIDILGPVIEVRHHESKSFPSLHDYYFAWGRHSHCGFVDLDLFQGHRCSVRNVHFKLRVLDSRPL